MKNIRCIFFLYTVLFPLIISQPSPLETQRTPVLLIIISFMSPVNPVLFRLKVYIFIIHLGFFIDPKIILLLYNQYVINIFSFGTKSAKIVT